MTHICVGILMRIGSDNDLLPGQCQAIIWTNARILLTEPVGTNFSEILIRIQALSFKKMHLKMSSAKWHPFCLSLNVLNAQATCCAPENRMIQSQTRLFILVLSQFVITKIQKEDLLKTVMSIMIIIDYWAKYSHNHHRPDMSTLCYHSEPDHQLSK